MNILVGTDIIEVDRIKSAINNNKDFLKKIYTEKEIEYCESKKTQKYQSYAARFAAKEAIYKALSDYIEDFKWTDFEVIKGKKGKPAVKLNININKLDQIEISMSHCKEYATAYVVAVFK